MTADSDRTGGFSEAERGAMKARAEELRAEKGGRKKATDLEKLFEVIEAMPEQDRAIAAGLHTLVSETAPGLDGRTWYGMPSWARDGEILMFMQPAGKFETRYATVGFNDGAALDDGDMWPTSFAVTRLTPEVRKRVVQLLERAVGQDS
ncbi:iron chaperone [Ornithinimicrobium sp. W1665]|uniref:iron chaperone n=1 Tax=Ornithinimicrobium sp. W1665 TaxID=3416666 RepID=UPI003CEA0EB3